MIQSAGADRESDGEVEEGHGFGHFYHEVSQRSTKGFFYRKARKVHEDLKVFS